MLRLGAAQFAATGGNLAANVAAHVYLIEAAAGEDVDVLVFPELSLTGYAADLLAKDTGACAVDPAAPALSPLREACRAHGVVAVVGAPVAGALAALVVDRQGEIAHVYAKQYLDGPEKDWFVAGEASALLEIGGRRLGLGICYDASFPEHARGLVLAGAEAYLVSGAFPLGESDHRRGIYFAARALENTAYVVFANYVGAHGGFSYGGRSAVYGPDGRVLADAGPEAPGLAVADIEQEALDRARAAATMLRDVKPAAPLVETVTLR